ncbi:hypothetical protein HYH02_006834 [Chlamydomonas schloesseri]|uniref:Glycosyltransferase family 92 protein n=1 Tax=Chlamydomonas schloesseri TaxID=2026947 RepID=A0A836B5M3_9CHLO|nr:hypothetical protein HYH02_006834 [Chlamydomonas schloesseri]|eukprot:KAG2448250.1 hypothetical protein HYH02_006834 [Chlamydomonas schloesseri]
MGVTSCWLPGRLPLRSKDDEKGPPVSTPVMLHVMLSTCYVPPSAALLGTAPAGGRGMGRTRLRVRGFVCVTREPQEDRCPTCHSYCLHNPFAEAMIAAAAAAAAVPDASEAAAATTEAGSGGADDSQLQSQPPPLFRLRSPHTGRVYPLSLSDEDEGLYQSGTPEDGGGLRGELELEDEADAAWQEFELHVSGFPYSCLMLPHTPPGQRQQQHQQLHQKLLRFPLGAAAEAAAATGGVGTVCGSLPDHLHTGGTAATGTAARPQGQSSTYSSSSGSPQQPPPAYFVLAPRHGLAPDALASVLVPHVAWHRQLGFTQYLLYSEEPPARLAAHPALRALLAARVLVLVLWDLTPPFSGALPVEEALREQRPGSLRRAYWHQMRTYDHALLTHWHEAGAVMAFADLDEYLITPGPTTVADLFSTCGQQPDKSAGEDRKDSEDTEDSEQDAHPPAPLGALRLPRMDGACSSCLDTVTGANTEPRHWAEWWARHAATATSEALAQAAGATPAATAAASSSGGGGAAGAAGQGAGADPRLLDWAHPLAAYDSRGYSDLPDMWNQKSIVLTEAAGWTSVHSPYVYPGFGSYGPVNEEDDVMGACAVWLHVTNQAKVRIQALPRKWALPPVYAWPLERIAAAASTAGGAGGGGGAGAVGSRAGAGGQQRGRSAAEARLQRLGHGAGQAGRKGGSGWVLRRRSLMIKE